MTRQRRWQLEQRQHDRCQRCGKSLGWRSVLHCHRCLEKVNAYLRGRRAAARELDNGNQT